MVGNAKRMEKPEGRGMWALPSTSHVFYVFSESNAPSAVLSAFPLQASGILKRVERTLPWKGPPNTGALFTFARLSFIFISGIVFLIVCLCLDIRIDSH